MNNISCKYCHSNAIVKYGTFEGKQRYWCKVCQRKFVDTETLPKMKTPIKTIASALSCYFGGMPLDSIQRHLQQQYNIYMSEPGIYQWIVRFSKEAIKKAKEFKPEVGDIWVADETVLKVGGRNVWFWDIIDKKSRFLLATRLSETRTTKDAALLMKAASRRAGKVPAVVITDKLHAYIDGVELVFGADTKHIRSKPFTDKDKFTNIIERFHGTLKDRTNVIRGFANMHTAKLLTDAWLVHYNFFKEHESLGNISPAQKMGIPVPFKDWEDILSQEKKRLIDSTTAKLVIRRQRRKPVRIYGKKRATKTMSSLGVIR